MTSENAISWTHRRWGATLGRIATKGAHMPESTDLAATIHGSPLTAQDAWWTEEADEVEGYDLLKDEALLQLVGVPFRIFRLTFRPGVQQKGHVWRNDYVSAEVRVAPAAAWDLKRILSRRKAFGVDVADYAAPGEQLVINDGSTGLYRQMVQYLEAKEIIKTSLVNGEELPAEGGKNESRYDMPASMFNISDDAIREGIAEVHFTPDGDQVTLFNVALKCSRGLRFSDYTSEYLPDGETARTWYIA
jgi:hypothetical protein